MAFQVGPSRLVLGALRPSPPALGPLKPTVPLERAHHKLGRRSKKLIRWPRLSLIAKQGRRTFYKGTGQMPGLGRKSAGSWDSRGRYRLEEHKLRTFVIPKPPFDHSLKPYVAKATMMTDAVKNQWPSRWKQTEKTATGEHISRDLPFDHPVDGHYLLQYSDFLSAQTKDSEETRRARKDRVERELAEASRPVRAPQDPDETELELSSLDPHIETPSEVMRGEHRRRAQRDKVAVDLEIEAQRRAQGLGDRDDDVEKEPDLRFTGQVAVPPRPWLDPAWNRAFNKGRGLRPIQLRRIPFGSKAPPLRQPKQRLYDFETTRDDTTQA